MGNIETLQAVGPSKLAATSGGDFVPLAVRKTTSGVDQCRMLANRKTGTTLISGAYRDWLPTSKPSQGI